jgi:hypothetical protein
MKTIKGFRFVKKNMASESGNAKWKVGEWKKHEGEVELCEAGFHMCESPLDSLDNIYGERWFTAEARGKVKKGKDKLVASEMRLMQEIPSEKVCVEFAIACARRALPRFEKKYPNDSRPREAIESAEAWLKSPTESNRKKARSAAESAARSAAWSAGSAWSAAERKWQVRKLRAIIKARLKNENQRHVLAYTP